jgi:uncharacterized membrane protein
MKKDTDIIIAAAAFWILGFLSAPLFAGSGVSDFLYRFYSVVCHQFESRSLTIHDHSLAVCARCTGIYGGFLAGVIAVRCSRRLRNRRFAPLALIAVSTIPMVTDVACELIGIMHSFASLRIITGAWFGAGLSLLLHRSLAETFHSLFSIIRKRYEPSTR